MQNVTLLSSFFEDSRIRALSLQKDGEAALLLWLRLFFAAVREDGDGRLMLYGDVPHDEKSIAALYSVPQNTVKSALQLLTRFGLLDDAADCLCISNFTELTTLDKRERHRQSQRRYAACKAESVPQARPQNPKPKAEG